MRQTSGFTYHGRRTGYGHVLLVPGCCRLDVWRFMFTWVGVLHGCLRSRSVCGLGLCGLGLCVTLICLRGFCEEMLGRLGLAKGSGDGYFRARILKTDTSTDILTGPAQVSRYSRTSSFLTDKGTVASFPWQSVLTSHIKEKES